MTTHKPVFHRAGHHACGRRIADKGEKLIKLPLKVRNDISNAMSLMDFRCVVFSKDRQDLVCTCYIASTPKFTSPVTRVDLQMYDKVNK